MIWQDKGDIMADSHFIETYTGIKFHYLNPSPGEICIEDIAHALSLICRFGGHCHQFYSVAEHSIRVSDCLPQELKLMGLLHDAAEAYISDLPRPIKNDLKGFQDLEEIIEDVIDGKYGLYYDFRVKDADHKLLATEARDLKMNMDGWAKLPEPLVEIILPQPSWYVEQDFLKRFEELNVNMAVS